jgi:acyl-CoA synthetase (AMP-forming)/AMP-acid ligase II
VAVYELAEGRVLTCGDLWREVEFFRRAFDAHLQPGLPIVSLVGNRAAFVTVLLAGLEHGAAVIPLDTGSTAAEALRWIDEFGARAVIAPASVRFDRAGTPVQLPDGLALLLFSELRTSPGTTGPAVLKVTSGSTGAPKAVVCSEGNLVADGLQVVEAMGIGPDDVNLAAIPMSHAYGLVNLVMPLVLQGSSLALREGFVPDRVFDDIDRAGATVFPGVPFMFERLVRQMADRTMPASMRLAISAGASIQADVVRAFKRAFGLKVHSFYGTSETGGIAYDADDAIDDPVTVGRALPGTTITLRPVDEPLADAFTRRPGLAFETRAGGFTGQGSPHGEFGRVHVRGAAVAARYAGSEAVDNSPFCDGGFLTGDLGRLDGDRLVLAGRVSEFVNVAGRKVHPGEVARVLAGMPEVSAALVVGVPCETRGEALVACIVPEGGRRVTVTALRTYCSDRLSSYKIPRHYVFVDALPVDRRGKTDRRALDALLAEHIRHGPAV